MTTSMIMMITSPLLTSLALLALLATAANARPLSSETSGSKLKMMITMINNMERSSTSTETSWEITGNDMSESSLIKGKVAPSPPPPKSSPPGGQGNFNGGSSSSASPKPYLSTLTSQLELILSCEEGSLCNSLISMFSNSGKTPKSQPSPSNDDMIELPLQQQLSPFTAGKTPKSPPSPKPSPSTHQDMIELPSPLFAAGKDPKSPPPPNPAPPKNQHMIELPIKRRSPPFAAGKTPKSPPSPKPAPSTHQDVIELPMQQPSLPFAAGKTPILPPRSPNPAPSTRQDLIELPNLQQRSPPGYVRFASS